MLPLNSTEVAISELHAGSLCSPLQKMFHPLVLQVEDFLRYIMRKVIQGWGPCSTSCFCFPAPVNLCPFSCILIYWGCIANTALGVLVKKRAVLYLLCTKIFLNGFCIPKHKKHICDCTSMFLPTPMGIHSAAQRRQEITEYWISACNDTEMYMHSVKELRDKWEIWHFLEEDQVTLVYLLSWSAEGTLIMLSAPWHVYFLIILEVILSL